MCPTLAIPSPRCPLSWLLSHSEKASHILPCYKYVQIPGQFRAPGPRQSWGYLSPNLQDLYTFHFQDEGLGSSDHRCPTPQPPHPCPLLSGSSQLAQDPAELLSAVAQLLDPVYHVLGSGG